MESCEGLGDAVALELLELSENKGEDDKGGDIGGDGLSELGDTERGDVDGGVVDVGWSGIRLRNDKLRVLCINLNLNSDVVNSVPLEINPTIESHRKSLEVLIGRSSL